VDGTDIIRGLMTNALGPHTDYTVRVPSYEGPLDLLLDLIERAELDITTVSLAMVTDQYLAHLRGLEQSQPDDISAFLVIAARLLQIKSEALLPRPPAAEQGEADEGELLVEQLKFYKRIREIGVWMDGRQQAGLRTYLRLAAPPKAAPHFDASGITLEALVAAANLAFGRTVEQETLASVIAAPRVTIREKIDLIARRMRDVRATTFRSLIEQHASRLEVVVTFLALLELIKRYRVRAHQEFLFSDIQIDSIGDWEQAEDFDLEFE
jgi:segregation and condensation protein A